MILRRIGVPDQPGSVIAECTECMMSWFEDQEPVEVLPGLFTRGGGPRPHQCPEPFPHDVAVSLRDLYEATGVPMSQHDRARILLGLRR